MELREPIEEINARLVNEFGRESNGQARFKIVFSEDQYEQRWTEFTDEGFQLLNPEVRLLPKYRQWIKAKYILERLIPVVGETDLTTEISYEPAWVFQDKNQNYLPPFFDGCKFIIEAIYAQVSKAKTHVKYKDPKVDPEIRKQELKKVLDYLCLDETDVGDALALGSGVTVPNNFEKSTEKKETVM